MSPDPSKREIGEIRTRIEAVCAPLDRRVDVIVNYDDAHIDPEIADEYVAMVQYVEDRFYGNVTRFSNSSFLRLKLGRDLSRDVAPHVFETVEEAQAFLMQRR